MNLCPLKNGLNRGLKFQSIGILTKEEITFIDEVIVGNFLSPSLKSTPMQIVGRNITAVTLSYLYELGISRQRSK